MWNRGIVVTFLSKRRSPVPYATIGMLHQLLETSQFSTAWLSRLDHVLRYLSPKYVIFGAKGVMAGRATADSTAESLPIHPADIILAKAISSHYRLKHTFGGAQLWIFEANALPSCQ